MGYIEVGCRLLIAVVFAGALAGKVTSRASFDAFVASLRGLRVVPPPWTSAAARASVTTEALITALMLVPVRLAGVIGFLLAAGLLVVFAAAIGQSLRQGIRAPCRCFGASSTPLGRRHVVRNAALVAVSLLGLGAALAGGPVDVAAAVVAGAAGLFVGVVIMRLDDIVSLLAPSR